MSSLGQELIAAAYEGVEIVSNRFRQVYRELSKEERDLITSIKDKADEMEQLFDLVAAGRYRALAMTSLEEAVMWIVKEVTL